MMPRGWRHPDLIASVSRAIKAISYDSYDASDSCRVCPIRVRLHMPQLDLRSLR